MGLEPTAAADLDYRQWLGAVEMDEKLPGVGG
jgi:hypothetical protein